MMAAFWSDSCPVAVRRAMLKMPRCYSWPGDVCAENGTNHDEVAVMEFRT